MTPTPETPVTMATITDAAPVETPRSCPCGASLEGKRADAIYCSHACRALYWRQGKDEERQAYYLRHRHGITPEALEHLRASQGGRCAICGRRRRLAIDHDHATGAIRGLLCDPCNRALGLLGDSPVRLRAAVAYLAHPAALEV